MGCVRINTIIYFDRQTIWLYILPDIGLQCYVFVLLYL